MKIRSFFALTFLICLAACSSEKPKEQAQITNSTPAAASGAPAGGATGGPGAKGFPAAPKGVARIGIGDEPFSLDANLANDIPSHKVLIHLQEGLVRLDGDCNPVPGVAESWEHSPDFRVWTFHLRPNAKWSNGDAVTSRDFVFSIRRIITPGTAAQYAQMVFNYLEGGKEFYESDGKKDENLGLDAPDDQTLVITLNDPTPFFLTIVAHTSWYPLNAAVVQKSGDAWAGSAATYVSNGAYTLAEWDPKNRLVAKKSGTYWDKANVHFNEIIFRPIQEESTELAAFESGELDVTNGVSIREAERLITTPEWFEGPYLGVYYVGFNVSRPPFNDLALRKAFSLAIDRSRIVKQVTKRGEEPAIGHVPRGIILPNGKDFREVAPALIDNSDYKANVEKARKLLADAGYGPNKPLPKVEYLYNTSDQHKDIGEALQIFWKSSIGAEVELQNVEWKVRIDRANAGDYQFGRFGWISDFVDPMSFLDMFETGGGNNDQKYANPEYDKLLAEARKELDPEKRTQIMIRLEKTLIEQDCVVAPIYFYREPLLVRTEMKGIVRNALGNLDLTRAWREGEK